MEPSSEPRALTEYLRALAEADSAWETSPVVKAQLLEEVRSLGADVRRARMKMAALAGTLIVATALPIWQLAVRPPFEMARTIDTASSAAIDNEIVTAFFPLFYSDVPISEGHIVRLELPRASYASFGVEPLGTDRGTRSDLVLADVVVGHDGLARAIRFVRTPDTDVQQEQRP